MGERVEHIAPEHSYQRLRVSSTYDHDLYDKLDRLACACGVSRTTLQTELIKMCLESESAINHIQERYKHKSRFRIIPSKMDGKLKYIFAEKKTAVR